MTIVKLKHVVGFFPVAALFVASMLLIFTLYVVSSLLDSVDSLITRVNCWRDGLPQPMKHDIRHNPWYDW